MTSATECLRALLDERGVRWSARTSCKTSWYSPVIHGPVAVGEWNDKLVLDTGYVDVTPEQAVAATLGPGTCHDDGDPSDFCCSECGVRMFTNTSDTYTMIAADEHTIIKHPSYCPNCGRKVVE